jgi:hypothetical protein
MEETFVKDICLLSNQTWRSIEQFAPASAAGNKDGLRRRRLQIACQHVAVLAFLWAASLFPQSAPAQSLLPSYGNLPLAFEENRGHAPTGVNYISRSRSGVVLLRPGSVTLESGEGKTIAMRFLGARKASTPTGEQRLPASRAI